MDAEFEIFRKAEFFHGKRNHCEILVEFLFKLGNVADVVNALVETACEFRGDCLCGNLLVGYCGEDEEEFDRCLRQLF